MLSRNSESFTLPEVYPYLIFYITYIPVKVFEPTAAVQEWLHRVFTLWWTHSKVSVFCHFISRRWTRWRLVAPTNPTEQFLLAKLTVPQLVKKCPALYEHRYFITAFTTTRRLPCHNPHSSSPLHILFKIDLNIILPSTSST